MRISRHQERGRQFLVEAYLARLHDSDLVQGVRRAQTAAEELTCEGRSVRYLRTIYLPDEETCFHLFDAGSADDVREATIRAGITCERVVDVFDIAARSDQPVIERPWASGSRKERR